VKIAVSGSRTYPNEQQVRQFVQSLPPDWEIVSGGCGGTDTWAVDEAKKLGMPYTEFYADWGRVGKAAGMMRNQDIVDRCDTLVAFPYGEARGTTDTIKRAVLDRKPVFVVDPDGHPPTVEQILERRREHRG